MTRCGSIRAAVSRLTKLRALKWPTVAYEVQKNVRSRARGRRGDLPAITAMGATLGNPAERVAYSRRAFEGYLAHGGLGRTAIEGRSVLELGPGEELTVALRFLAAGATHVSCVDRFVFDVDPTWERAVYASLRDDLDPEQRERLAGIVGPDGELAATDPRLDVVRGVGVEDAAERLGGRRFDLMVSVAVLEHVYDLSAALRTMDALLEPGGLMLHQVDLRDHGMFSAGGRHPLEFLTIPERVYHAMTSHTGAPNRERIGTYRRLLAELGHEAQIKITNVGGSATDIDPYREELSVGREVDSELTRSIDALRKHLPARFASLPTEELAATGIFVRSRKPGRAA
jgi:hypothetical protein